MLSPLVTLIKPHLNANLIGQWLLTNKDDDDDDSDDDDDDDDDDGNDDENDNNLVILYLHFTLHIWDLKKKNNKKKTQVKM